MVWKWFEGILSVYMDVVMKEMEMGSGGVRFEEGHFVEVCRRSLKVNVGKSKVMVLNGEEGLEYKVCMDGMQLENISEFKYLGCVLDESGRWRVGGGLQVLLGFWSMLEVYSLSVLGFYIAHSCSYLW